MISHAAASQEGNNSVYHLRSGEVVARLSFEKNPPSIIGYLGQHGAKLYRGFLQPDIFTQHAQTQKQILLRHLVDISQETEDSSFILRFCLRLMYEAQETDWRYPALFNNWGLETGRSRIFASYMTHRDPWFHVPALFLLDEQTNPDTILQCPQLITDDQILNDILGCDIDKIAYPGRIFIDIRILHTDNKICPKLEYIGDGKEYDPDPGPGHRYLRHYCEWWEKYHENPKISIYTNWPEMLTDSMNFWKRKIVGSSQTPPGHIERLAFFYHGDPDLDTDHVLWITRPRKIDLSDLLFWMDTKYSNYIESNSDFILYRHQPQFLSKFINVPHYSIETQ